MPLRFRILSVSGNKLLEEVRYIRHQWEMKGGTNGVRSIGINGNESLAHLLGLHELWGTNRALAMGAR